MTPASRTKRTSIKHIGELEIEQGAASYPRALFVAQLIAWIVMLLLVIAALIGFTSPGIMGPTIISNESISIKFYRFIRSHYVSEITLQIPTQQTSAQQILKLYADGRYLRKMEIKQIIPAPIQVEAHGKDLIYYFLVKPSHQPMIISMLLEPHHIGCLKGFFGIDSDSTIEFKQFAYP